MKKFTYSFLSILMLLLAMPAGLLARTTVTFDFAANPWGLPTSTGTDKKGTITAPVTQDGVVLTTVSNNDQNPNQLFGGKSASLRVYNESTFTFTAPEGKVIEKIEFTGTVAATADAGTYDGSSKTWAQPKEQVNAVKFTATGTNKIKKAVLTIADPGEAEEVVVLPEIADFASLKTCEIGKAVKLTVTNGKVVYAGSKDLIVEDATGAIDFYNWGVKATAGQVINGVVEAKYDEFLGMPQAAKTANTDVAALTITDGDAVAPVAMEFADAMKATSYLKYVTLADFAIEDEVVGEGETAKTVTYLVSGENKIQLFNKFKVEYTLPENIKSISGIIIPFVAKGSTDVVVEIAPTCAEDIVEETAVKILEVNSIAELCKLTSDKERAEIKLKLTDAQIKYADETMSSMVLIEDATGAFNAQYFFAEAMGMEMLTGNFKQGSVLNGDLYCLYSYPGSIEVSEENTAKSQIAVTEAPVVAKEAQLADVWKAENNYRLYEFKDVTVNKNEEDKFQLVQDGVKVSISDITHQLSEEMMATVVSVTGFLRIVGEDAEFILLSYKAKEAPAYTEVNSIAELRAIKVEEEYAEVPVKINLHDAKITVLHKNSDYGMEMIDFAILEDATGAVSIGDLMMEATMSGMLEGNFETGSVLNGTLYAIYNWPNSLWADEDNTPNSELTITPSTVAPTEATLAEVIKPENDLRVFKLQDVTIKKVGTEDAPDYDFCQGEQSIQLRDAFALWFSDGSNMPEKLQSVTGILYAEYESLDQETPKYFFTPLSYEETPAVPEIPVVENIAALSKIEGGEMENPSVKLMLKNAKITYVQNTEGDVPPEYSVMYALLEDETGAVEISDLVAKAKLNNWFNGELKEGVALNGYVLVDYSSFFPRLVVNAETAKSEITVTPTTIVPTEAKIADIQKAENHLRLFELKNVDFAVEDDTPVIKQDDASIILADQFVVLPKDMPETAKFESVVGVVFLDLENYVFCPISYKFATSDGISALEVAAKNAAVYNLNGAKVRNAGESVKGLAKGIYVVGGKKIVVK